MAKKQDPRPPMHVDLLWPSKYVKASDLQGRDCVVTIKKVHRGELWTTDGGKKKKVLISFENAEKDFVCNVTNGRLIATALGEEDAAKWRGGRITIYPTRCRGKEGKMCDCIRVRDKAPAARRGAAPAAEPEPEEPRHDEPVGQDPFTVSDDDIPMDNQSEGADDGQA